jgi:hypothetical protein
VLRTQLEVARGQLDQAIFSALFRIRPGFGKRPGIGASAQGGLLASQFAVRRMFFPWNEKFPDPVAGNSSKDV